MGRGSTHLTGAWGQAHTSPWTAGQPWDQAGRGKGGQRGGSRKGKPVEKARKGLGSGLSCKRPGTERKLPAVNRAHGCPHPSLPLRVGPTRIIGVLLWALPRLGRVDQCLRPSLNRVPGRLCPPGASECDLVWTWGFCRCNELGRGHSGFKWALHPMAVVLTIGEKRHRGTNAGRSPWEGGGRDGSGASTSQRTPRTAGMHRS